MEIGEFYDYFGPIVKYELQAAIKVANFFLHSSKILKFAIKYNIILAPMRSVNCKQPSKLQISFFTQVKF